MGMKRSVSLRLGASILALTAAGQAWAQEATEVSEIVVTGASIRGVAATGSPVTVAGAGYRERAQPRFKPAPILTVLAKSSVSLLLVN